MRLRHVLSSVGLGTLALVVLTASANANSYGSGATNADQARVSEDISIFQMPRNRTNEIIGILRADETVTIQRCTVDGNWCRVLSEQPTGWVPASYLVGSPAKADATPLGSLTSPRAPQQRRQQRGGSFF